MQCEILSIFHSELAYMPLLPWLLSGTGVDFYEWSPALHVLSWVPAGTCFPPCSSLHSLLSQYLHSLLYNTHLTQHFRYTILYLLVFFVKKNLECIRTMFYFIFIFC